MPILSTTGAATAQAYGFGGGGLYKLVISTNQTDVNLRTLALASGWNGTSSLLATIQSGIYVSSSSTSTPALTISGSFPGGVQLVNSGYIVGMGGAGGSGSGLQTTGYPGNNGGLALSVLTNVFINNLGTIGGGGGGGGGGGAMYALTYDGWGGGGGGGGRSGTTSSSGGAAGSYYEQNARGTQAGFSGTTSGGGAGGYGALTPNSAGVGGTGGTGGTWGSAGSTGQSGYWGGEGGGVTTTAGGAGGAAGGAVTGNSYITWIATGTRLGSIS